MTQAENIKAPYNSSVRNNDTELKTEEVEILVKLGRLEEAAEIIDKLVESGQGKNVRVIETALYLYQSLGRFESAQKMGDALYALRPEDHALLKIQGEIAFQLRDYKSAERKLEQYHEKTQDDYRSYHLLGDVYTAMGKNIEGRKSYERALNILHQTKD